MYMADSVLPVLFPDRASTCGWLYGAFVLDGEVITPPTLTLVWFTPFRADPAYDFNPACDMCGCSGPLWEWVDLWAGGVSVSGIECESCIRSDDGDPTQSWVPSPLALTAG